MTWSDFGKVLGNLAILVGKTIATVVSVAGAIASEGLTAPIAALSYASTASSWYDFIKSPTGNVNRSIVNTAEWIGKTFGAGTGEQVITAINTASKLDPFTSTASSLGFDTITTAPRFAGNVISLVKNRITAINRTTGANTADAASITRIVSPAMRIVNMAQGNRVDRVRAAAMNIYANAVSSPSITRLAS